MDKSQLIEALNQGDVLELDPSKVYWLRLGLPEAISQDKEKSMEFLKSCMEVLKNSGVNNVVISNADDATITLEDVKQYLDKRFTDYYLKFVKLYSAVKSRQAYYKRDLDRNKDADGEELDEGHRIILTNLYNICAAIAASVEEENNADEPKETN